MRVLLVNPPNCGRSIPEERYGIYSLKQIFRGEPLALEVLAGSLIGHEVRILDLKVEPEALADQLHDFAPEVVAITGVTCEANTMVRIAAEAKRICGATTVVGGIHASCDPGFFNRQEIDYIAIGLGKAALAELITAMEAGAENVAVAGIARTKPGAPLEYGPRTFTGSDLVEQHPPRYDLVAGYRDSYILSSLGIKLGFVASAYGCPYDCSFCCISSQAGGRYLTHSIDAVIRDIRLLPELPVIRLVDANTFGNAGHARLLAQTIIDSGVRKSFIADVRSDTVVRHPELMRLWKEAGLRSVIIGFEEIGDDDLSHMNKASSVAVNSEAIRILHDLGITIVGDFIISPEYDEARFEALGSYVTGHHIDLPILTVLTPLPGTPLHARMRDRILIDDLDYYTLTNAVTATKLDEKKFYEQYAGLTRAFHARAKI